MHNLQALTPLGRKEAATLTVGSVCVTENISIALASVASRLGQEAEAAKVLKTVLGAAVPESSRIAGKKLSAFWVGPDQWMIEAPLNSHETLAVSLAAKANGTFSVTEQTDGWCRFDLEGQGLPSVFERLCNVNTRVFKDQEVQRTSMDHIGCFLLCRDPQNYTIYAPRSSAGSLFHAIEVALKSAL